jgi:hypothetical protein
LNADVLRFCSNTESVGVLFPASRKLSVDVGYGPGTGRELCGGDEVSNARPVVITTASLLLFGATVLLTVMHSGAVLVLQLLLPVIANPGEIA